jgi:transcriptional regulator GlxA family with amidase domain
MLEFSRSSVEVIAGSIGYYDARAFRRVFRNIVGLA